MTIQAAPPATDFFSLVLEALAKIVPALDHESEADVAMTVLMARMLFSELRPADAVQAATAARAIAAHFAAMDNFARAAKPGVSDEKAIRLRGNALAASRVFEKEVRTLPTRRQAVQTDNPPHAPRPVTAAPAFIPDPASNIRHRTEAKTTLLGMADQILRGSRRPAWRGGTALSVPTVAPPE